MQRNQLTIENPNLSVAEEMEKERIELNEFYAIEVRTIDSLEAEIKQVKRDHIASLERAIASMERAFNYEPLTIDGHCLLAREILTCKNTRNRLIYELDGYGAAIDRILGEAKS